MADFSLTTLFVVPVGSTIANSGSTQDLIAGKVGFFGTPSGTGVPYSVLSNSTITTAPYFYVAQGRTNTYLQGSKRSDKISGCPSGSSCRSNITEWYTVNGCPTPLNQITQVSSWNVKCGDVITLTLRAHSSYIDTLYFNGFTRSITVVAPCCDCGGDPCTQVDYEALVTQIIAKFEAEAPGNNPDNISFNTFYSFTQPSAGVLRITGKALTRYGVPCDVAAFPWEYDRMYFRTFVYSGPATTADFIVDDSCNVVASTTVTQVSSYPSGTSDEIIQLEKNYYSYQAGYLKHLYRMAGYNQNFESWVSAGTTYDTYYIKFNEYDKSAYQWGDYIYEDSMVIIAVPQGSAAAASVSLILTAALGTPQNNSACTTSTTTSTTTVAP
jgi:hypothetical protein